MENHQHFVKYKGFQSVNLVLISVEWFGEVIQTLYRHLPESLDFRGQSADTK